MIEADVAQRLSALRAITPFDRLEDAELALIARQARPRTFPAGQVLIPAGAAAEALFVRLAGGALTAGHAAPAVFDAPGLLFGLAARAEYLAGPEGLTALMIAKPHVFTIARECPEFVVGLRGLEAAP